MVKVNKGNQSICETDKDGNKYWYLNDRLHREDGPAIEFINGHKEWHFCGELHRLDGPAIKYASGDKCWFVHGKYINCDSQKEFERLIKLKILW